MQITDAKSFKVSILPEKGTGNLVRSFTYSNDSQSRYKGQKVYFLTLELGNLAVKENGLYMGGQQGAGRKVINVMSHLHSDDFDYILDNCINDNRAVYKEGATAAEDQWTVSEKDSLGNYVSIVAEGFGMQGRFYSLETPRPYIDTTGVERTHVRFFIPRGILDENPNAMAEQFSWECERLGLALPELGEEPENDDEPIVTQAENAQSSRAPRRRR